MTGARISSLYSTLDLASEASWRRFPRTVARTGTDRRPPIEGPHVSDKSPRQAMAKKSGKSLKEKRADKRAKSDTSTNDNIFNPKGR